MGLTPRELDCIGGRHARSCQSRRRWRRQGVTDRDNARVFSSEMMGRDPLRCLEEIRRFASERRQGEMANVRNLAALLVERLKAVG